MDADISVLHNIQVDKIRFDVSHTSVTNSVVSEVRQTLFILRIVYLHLIAYFYRFGVWVRVLLTLPQFGVHPLLPNLDASARDIVTRKQCYHRDSVWVNLNSLTANNFSFKFMLTSPSISTVDTHLSCNALAVELIWSIYTSSLDLSPARVGSGCDAYMCWVYIHVCYVM